MKLLVKTLYNEQFTIECEQSDTVRIIKEKIAMINNLHKKYNADAMKLFYIGRVLQDSETLVYYSINEENFVVVVPQTPGKKLQIPKTITSQLANTASSSSHLSYSSTTGATQLSSVPQQSQTASSTVSQTPFISSENYEKTLRHLIDMGFDRTKAALALRASSNDLNRATELLLMDNIPNFDEGPLTTQRAVLGQALNAAPSSEQISESNQRFLDAVKEPHAMLLPIEGYENMSLVPLVDSVESLEYILPKVKRNAWIAKERSTKPDDGLRPDESAAIQLYTMEWRPSHESLYVKLNIALRAENRDQLVPYFSYLKLMLTALWKLKPVRKTVWRGVKADLSTEYSVGKNIVWWGFSSCTETLDVLESNKFLGKTGVRTLFSIECESGRAIRSHTYFKHENEILLLPGTQFRVIGKLNPATNLHIIHLVETQPPYPLLQPPF